MHIDDQLVDAVLAGDSTAFATMFDRHAPHVHDHALSVLRDPVAAAEVTRNTFLAAAHRLGQLHDPSSLRVWLHAIARSQTLAAADPALRVVTARGEAPPPSGDARDLVWLTATNLSAFDRDILDLHLRQNFDGAELAAVVRSTPEAASARLDAALAELNRLAGPALVVFGAHGECGELNALTFETVGPSTMTNVAVHITTCAGCSARQQSMTSPAALFSAAPMRDAPPELRRDVLASVHLGAVEAIGWDGDGFPVAPSPPGDSTAGAGTAPRSVFDEPAPWIVAGVAAVAAVVLALGFLYYFTRSDNAGVSLADGPESPVQSDEAPADQAPALEPTPVPSPPVEVEAEPEPSAVPDEPVPPSSGPIGESVTGPADPDSAFAGQAPPFLSVLAFVCNDPMEIVVEVDSPLPYRVALEWQWGLRVESVELAPIPDNPGRWRGSLAAPTGSVSPRVLAESAAGTRTITFSDCSI